MPRTDREVFDYLRQDAPTPVEIDFLAYSVLHSKNQWFEQLEETTGSPPSAADVDRWIADIAPTHFLTMREDAARLFDATARKYLAPVIEEQKAEAVRRSILAEVKGAGSVWRQMLIALVTAILAPLIIGGVIASALTYDRMAPTASGIWKSLEGRQEIAPPNVKP